MNTKEKYASIEKYIDGVLEGPALKIFETQLQNDVTLQEELELHKQVHQMLRTQKRNEFKTVLREVEAEWRQPALKTKSTALNFSF